MSVTVTTTKITKKYLMGKTKDALAYEFLMLCDTNGKISASNDILLDAVKMAYRKHHLEDRSIGWEELGNHLMSALCEAMGDQEFQKWLTDGEK